MEEGVLRASRKPQRHTMMVMVRFTPEDHATVEQCARLSGVPVATYIRAVSLGRVLAPVVPAVNYDAIGQLRRIGNNINQALVTIYTGKVPSSFRPMLLELITLIRKLRAELSGKVAVEYEREPVVQPANDPELADPANDTDPSHNGAL